MVKIDKKRSFYMKFDRKWVLSSNKHKEIAFARHGYIRFSDVDRAMQWIQVANRSSAAKGLELS